MSQQQNNGGPPTTRNRLIPDEEHRLRETNGQISPPDIDLRPEESQRLLETEGQTKDGTPRKSEKKPPVRFTDELKKRFVDLLAQYGVYWKCAKAVGVSAYTVTLHKKDDEEFAEACELAMSVFRDSIEETIIDRAVHGWEEPVYSQRLGTQIGTIHRFDNKLLELLAKRHIPEYRDKQQIDHNVSGGVLVAPASPASAEDWEDKHRKQVESQSRPSGADANDPE